MQLNLATDRPEQYEGREYQVNGTRYVLGRRLEAGRDWQTHLLVNYCSKLALHQIQVPTAPGSGMRHTMVQMDLAAPRPVRGSITVATPHGPIVLHPLTQLEDANLATAEAWDSIPAIGNPSDLVPRYHAILRLNRDHSPTRFALSELAGKAGEWGQALQLVSECLDIEHNWLPYQLHYFWCCVNLGRPRLTVLSYQRLATMFPGEEPHAPAVNHLLALGDVAAAQAAADSLPADERDAATIIVQQEGALLERARPAIHEAYELVQCGHDEAALEKLEEAWRIHPRSPWLRFNLALARWRAGRMYEAWAIVRPSLYLVPLPFLPTLGVHLAAMCIELGWVPNALNLLSEAQPLPSPSPRLRWHDDGRTQFEETNRAIRGTFFDLASAASRATVEIPLKARQILKLYDVPIRPSQFVAGEYQIESVLKPTVVRVRSALSGHRYLVRFMSPLAVEINLPQHPCLLTPLFQRQAGNQRALFFHWQDGGTLQDWIQSGELYRTPQPIPRLLEIALRIAWGLDAAHRFGRVHGQVSPLRILMSSDGSPCILFRYGGSFQEAFMRLMQEGLTPETTSATDIAGWAQCVLAMFGKDDLDGEPREVAPRLPDELLALLRQARDPDQPWHSLAEPVERLTKLYAEWTGRDLIAPASWTETAEPVDLLELSDVRISQGDYLGAVHALERAEPSLQHTARGWTLRSIAQRRLGFADDARVSATAALEAAVSATDVVAASEALAHLQDPPTALTTVQAAVARAREAGEALPQALAVTASVSFQLHDLDQTLACCDEALVHPEAISIETLARLYALKAFALWPRHIGAAQACLRQSCHRYEEWVGREARLDARLFLAQIYIRGGEAVEKQGRPVDAAAWFGQASDILDDLLVERGCSVAAPALAESLQKTASVMSDVGRLREAVACALRCVKLWRNMSENRSAQTLLFLARAHTVMARTLTAGGSPELAMASLSEVRELFKAAPPPAQDFGMLCLEEGIALKALGDLNAAVQRYRDGLAGVDEAAHTPLCGLLWSNLGTSLDLQGNPEEAFKAFELSIECWSKVDTAESRLQTALAIKAQGSTLLKQSQQEAALERYAQAEKLLLDLPGHPTAEHTLTLLHAAQAYARGSSDQPSTVSPQPSELITDSP